MISRRAFLAGFGAMVGGAGLLSARQQGSSQENVPAPADPLSNPQIVQSRTVVTEGDNSETIQAVERRLKCTCGCNLDIFTCRTTDFTCTVSPALHRQVMSLHDAGSNPEQIVDAFVAEYGEEILMAPPPRGFNLAGYLVPGLAITAAGALLAAILMRRESVAPVPAANGAAGAQLSPEDQARLDQALAEVVD